MTSSAILAVTPGISTADASSVGSLSVPRWSA